ncbi:hypothetical protein QE152_g25430 [Popillia japonica]|uniref:Uncharacterized protein n=1 Tax=Popillia japonica TaxID=7064 RepID=A0AAW1K237_POPJA
MDSDDYVTDEGKRKQNPSGATESLGKSLKIRKMPDRRQSSEDKLEKIMEMILELKQDVREDLRSIREEQQLYRTEIKQLKEENEKLKKENTELKQEICQINESIEIIDRDRRRNNVVVQGLTMHK